MKKIISNFLAIDFGVLILLLKEALNKNAPGVVKDAIACQRLIVRE